MAWFEAHQTMARHPKTLKLARLIKKDRRYAVGLLHDLFSWALDAAQKDGTLNGATADDIAAALDFTGKTGLSVVEALIESGYMEQENGVYKIHDWYDYAGKLADQREAAKRRKQEFRERGRNGDGTGTRTLTERERNGDGTPLPYPTVPNPTVSSEYSFDLSAEKERKEKEKKESRNDHGLAAVMSYFLDNIDQNPPGARLEFVKAMVETKGAEKVKTALEAAIEAGRKDWPWVLKAINEA